MAYSAEVRNKVRISYVRDMLSLQKAAERNGVPYNTARTWKREALKKHGDDWEQARTASRLIQGGAPEITAAFMDDFVRVYHDTVKELRDIKKDNPENYSPLVAAEALSKMADAWSKTTAALTRGRPHLNKLTVAMELLEHLNTWLRENHPDKMAEWVEMIEPFSEYLTRAIKP